MTANNKPDNIEITNTHIPSRAPICNQVKIALDDYFSQINGHKISGLHALVMAEVEKPLIVATLEHTGYNQCKASKILGMSRSTLRKKIERYNIA